MIIKHNLRNQVRQILYDQLLSAELHPKDKISLAALSRELNTSVTPIREALTQMEHAGIIEAVPNVGFVVKELSKEEAKQAYEIIGVLEELALKQTVLTEKTIKKLKRISSDIKKENDSRARIRLDNEFHERLIADSRNQKALELMKNLKLSVYIYELAFMDQQEMKSRSNNSHEKIIKQLEEGKLSQAASYLNQHWQLSYQFINNQP